MYIIMSVVASFAQEEKNQVNSYGGRFFSSQISLLWNDISKMAWRNSFRLAKTSTWTQGWADWISVVNGKGNCDFTKDTTGHNSRIQL